MTTVTDYLDSARVSLMTVVDALKDFHNTEDEDFEFDIYDNLTSAKDALVDLNKAISLLGGL